jgi:hypothetical protein
VLSVSKRIQIGGVVSGHAADLILHLERRRFAGVSL